MEARRRTVDREDLVPVLLRVALGAAGLLITAAASALKEIGRPQKEPEERSAFASSANAVLGVSLAFMAAGLEAQRRMVELWSARWEGIAPLSSRLARLSVIARPLAELQRRVGVWREGGEREQLENERLGRELFSEAVPAMVAAMLDHVDLDDL